MPTCFVMQPFDGGAFDQRYREVYSKAIEAAGLEPYRVDQDPKVSIPIQEIERGIRLANVCLAEISEDNPNVWFELGYAIACRKEVVLICSDARQTKFPFDVQHRTIIRYRTGSPSDFETLKQQITSRIEAAMEKSAVLASAADMAPLTTPSQGLSDHEVVALAAVAQNVEHEEDHASTWQIQQDMEANGYTKIATNFALKALTSKALLSSGKRWNEHHEDYFGYSLTESGWEWLLANQERFSLRKPAAHKHSALNSPPAAKAPNPFDDEIPF